MKSWKTTVLGILAVLSAVIGVVQGILGGNPVDWGTVIPAIMAGVGLIIAKDFNVTGVK